MNNTKYNSTIQSDETIEAGLAIVGCLKAAGLSTEEAVETLIKFQKGTIVDFTNSNHGHIWAASIVLADACKAAEHPSPASSKSI